MVDLNSPLDCLACTVWPKNHLHLKTPRISTAVSSWTLSSLAGRAFRLEVCSARAASAHKSLHAGIDWAVRGRGSRKD